MLDLDVAGYATVTADGIDIEKAPEGITFAPLPEDARAALLPRRLGREVRGAQRGALAARTPRRRPEGRRAREAALRPHLRDRPDVLAARRRRGGRRPRVADRGVRVAVARHRGLLERGHRALRRAGREARVRLAPEPLPRDVALREPSRARRARRRARLGRRRLRLEEGQDADPERPQRPRRDLARHRRVLRRRHAASRLRHVPGAHRSGLRERLRLQGRAARRGDRGVARDDPRREGRAEDERVPGVPQPDAQPDDARGADPGARDPRERRPLHPRRDGRPGEPGGHVLSDEPRA